MLDPRGAPSGWLRFNRKSVLFAALLLLSLAGYSSQQQNRRSQLSAQAAQQAVSASTQVATVSAAPASVPQPQASASAPAPAPAAQPPPQPQAVAQPLAAPTSASVNNQALRVVSNLQQMQQHQHQHQQPPPQQLLATQAQQQHQPQQQQQVHNHNNQQHQHQQLPQPRQSSSPSQHSRSKPIQVQPPAPRISPKPKQVTSSTPEPEEDAVPGAPTDVKFECPRPDGLFADPNSCKKFILCGSSHPWQQTCPPGLYFDSKLKFCTFKTSTLTCGPVSDEEEVRQDEATQEAQNSLPTCDSKCQLPDCFCSPDGTTVPGNLSPQQVPQMVLLSFSGAINEMVFDHYKKILGYTTKFNAAQTRLNPNGCGIKSTFFVSHEYSNYAQVHWLAAQGHEIGLHSITHRLPELWWTDKANYSDWVEEIVGMREILLQLTNINGDSPVIKRDDIVGMRAPYIKPGGDAMYQMINDFGLQYSTSIVAPKAEYPLWPFTLDSKVPFDCANIRNNKPAAPSTPTSGDAPDSSETSGDPQQGQQQPQRRHRRSSSHAHSHLSLKRSKRQSTFAGKSLKCPTKAYPGVWEVPLNPLSNELSSCHHLDQCVFPSQDDHSDSSDIVQFLVENFERHYNTTRAPFQINLHVQWVLNSNRLKALTKFIDHVSKTYPNTWFVSFRQMLEWLRNPSAPGQPAFKCEEPGKVKMTSCNRPQTCVVNLNTDSESRAISADSHHKRSDARYLQLCPGISCPKVYPWFGNILGAERNLKSVLDLVQETSTSTSSSNSASTGAIGGQDAPAIG